MPTLHTSKHVHPSIEQPLPSRTIQPNSTRPHTHIRAYMHTHLPSRTHAHAHTCIHTLVQSFTHTCVHPYIHTYSTRTHTHTRMRYLHMYVETNRDLQKDKRDQPRERVLIMSWMRLQRPVLIRGVLWQAHPSMTALS